MRTELGVQLNIRISNDDGNLNPMKDKTVLPLAWLRMVTNYLRTDSVHR